MQALPIPIAERVEHELSTLFGREIAAGRGLRRGSGRLQAFLLREGRERAGLLRRGLRAEGGEGIGHGRILLAISKRGINVPHDESKSVRMLTHSLIYSSPPDRVCTPPPLNDKTRLAGRVP